MKKIKQAVILAGGLGTRLRPLTLHTPKPMIEIHGKPFLAYILDLLKKNNITNVLLLTGYLGEKIEDYFGNGKNSGLHISYLRTPDEYDTGSRLREAKNQMDEIFLLLYADNYWPMDLPELFDYVNKKQAAALVTIYANNDNYSKNNMRVSHDGFVIAYDKTRERAGLNGVDIGFFILKKSVLNDVPNKNFSFEEIIIPRLIKSKQLAGFVTTQKYYGLSNIDRIAEISNYFSGQ